MKKLLLFIALIVLLAGCGDKGSTPVIVEKPVPPGVNSYYGLRWKAPLVNKDGSPIVVDGYKVTSTNQDTHVVYVTNVGNTTEVSILSVLKLPDGTWCSTVLAYNGAGDGPECPAVCFKQKSGTIKRTP